MHFVVLGLAAVALFLAWRRGWLRNFDTGDFAAIAGLVLGFRWLMTGNGLLAIACFGGVAGWAWFRARQLRQAEMTCDEARILLDLAPGATPDAIRAAHRRLIARVHPDVGGSVELARRVNAARDALLSEARSKVPDRRE